MHYPTIEDIHKFIGTKNKGALSLTGKIYYKILPEYIPKEILDNWSEENDPFWNPDFPYYYKPKDEN